MIKKALSKFFQKVWYRKPGLINYLLLPFTWVYCFINYLRYSAYCLGILSIHRFKIPVIVIGNITVGGTGKTPVVATIARLLTDHGYHPGIILRGYGNRNAKFPMLVTDNSAVDQAGDEALMLAIQTQLPIVIDPKRVRGVKYLIEKMGCDIIISDDGLQHYHLGRDVEIILVDRQRKFGNGFCLPAGPLRESLHHLKDADFILYKTLSAQFSEQDFYFIPGALVQLISKKSIVPQANSDDSVHAVCAIANAEHFFQTLELLGWKIKRHAFPDHYHFSKKDFAFDDKRMIIMTHKDAVKCQDFADDRFWYLSISVALPPQFPQKLLEALPRRKGTD